MRIRFYPLVIVAFCCQSTLSAEVNFETEVAPLIIKRCLECHQDRSRSGGLSLSSLESFSEGGDSGAVVDDDSPLSSYLLERIQAGDMPPKQRGISQQLPEEEIAILQAWVAEGATWPAARELDLYEATSSVRAGRDWWSLQAVQRPTPPDPSQLAGGQQPVRFSNAIDLFIQQELRDAGLQAAPRAEPEILLRRLTADTIGLPPTPEEIAQLETDSGSNAWSTLVDRYLASPQFGERWARHWLDIARFAESSGYERDQTKPFAWKYRDWVVDAINSDMPYDEFVVLQLAGDEIPDRDERSLAATGFLRLGTWNDEPNDPEDYAFERLEDLVHTTSSAFLGMTVKCARCHDHKFDPIPQLDYYRMASIFWPGPIQARDRKWLGGPTDDELDAQEVLAWTDITQSPAPLHLLKDGDRQRPLEEVVPAVLTLVPDLFRELDAPTPKAKGTQRRLQFAKWIASPENPLTARVIVNRIWQNYMGQGLVRSPNNFGFTGEQPTHPDILDWLAAELVDSGWSLKHIHRLILNSETYRQSSNHQNFDEYSQRDYDNRLWWRAERRRRDAESLRDALLVATGELDSRRGGPSFIPSVSQAALEGLSQREAAWNASPQSEQMRRSLYTFMQRSLLPPLMTTFDLCDSTLSNAKRDVTTVAPQALAMLNNQFVQDRSQALAGRVLAEYAEPENRVHAVWGAVLQRVPEEWEVRAGTEYLERQRQRIEEAKARNVEAEESTNHEMLALASLSLILFNSNEFAYVD